MGKVTEVLVGPSSIGPVTLVPQSKLPKKTGAENGATRWGGCHRLIIPAFSFLFGLHYIVLKVTGAFKVGLEKGSRLVTLLFFQILPIKGQFHLLSLAIW